MGQVLCLDIDTVYLLYCFFLFPAPGNVEVFCVDYGKREYTSLDSIRPLHPKFATLPCHSFNCALSEVT